MSVNNPVLGSDVELRERGWLVGVGSVTVPKVFSSFWLQLN